MLRVSRSFVSSAVRSANQNWPQPITNLISQCLGFFENIGIMFFELLTPELTSIRYINQLHMQEQLVIVTNHFTCGDGVDEEVFAQPPKV